MDRIQVRGEIFRIRLDRPWGPSSFLNNGYRVFPAGKRRWGCGVDHPPPSSAEVKEKVELRLYSPFGPSWPEGELYLYLYLYLIASFDINAFLYVVQKFIREQNVRVCSM